MDEIKMVCYKCKQHKDTTSISLPDGEVDYCEDCLKEYKKNCGEVFKLEKMR